MALEKLSGDLQDQTCVSYLLCRIPDTVEDTPHIQPEDKAELLEQYGDLLEDPSIRGSAEFVRDVSESLEDEGVDIGSLEREDPDWELLKNTHKVFNAFEVSYSSGEVEVYINENVGELVDGMRQVSQEVAESDYQGIRIQDTDEFEQYCYFVAGTVGNLLTDLFVHHEDISEEEARELGEIAPEFGEYLQTVNVIKDPYKDLKEENAVFIPEEVMERHGTSHQEFAYNIDEGSIESETEVIKWMTERASEKQEKALEYIESIPEASREVRRYLQVPYFLAVATNREARRSPEDAFTEDGIRISKAEALTLLEKADESAEDESIEALSGRIKQGPVESWKNRFKAVISDFKERVSD